MSDYHLLGQSQDKKTMQVVYHYVVPPAATNSASILFTDIVKLCCDLSSQIPNHSEDFPAEYAAMQAGEVVEEFVNFRFSTTSLTPVQKRTEIMEGNANGEPSYANRKTAYFAEKQIEWEWYGYSGDVS